ncbi:TolC family protein [Shewanella sp. 10N.286.51.B2]|uniref:TolC family protein n=1 Tax=Shewanella sp. 10N.286.51.B2 TaxID=3229707 RepID=UPI0035546660
MKIIKFALILLCVVNAASTRASELSLLIDQALRNNYQIISSEFELVSSEYDLQKGTSPFLPTVNIQANSTWNESKTTYPNPDDGSRTDNDYNSNGYSLSLSQVLLDYSIVYDYDLSKLELQINEIKHNKILNDIIIKVVENYFSYLKFKAQHKATKVELKSSQARLEQISRNNELGNVAKTDVYEAYAKKEQNAKSLASIEKDIRISLIKLNSTTQTKLEPKFDIQLNQHYQQIPSRSKSKLKKNLAHKNYDIIISQYNIKKSETTLDKTKSGFYPTISASANYSVNDSNNNVETYNDDISYSLNINVPIMSGGSTYYEYQKNKNKIFQSIANHRQSIDDAGVEFDELIYQINDNVTSINLLRKIIISNYSVYKGTQKAYKIGTKTLTDLLSSESNLYNSIRDFYSNQYDYIINMTKFDALLGPVDLNILSALSNSMVPIQNNFDLEVLEKLKKEADE